MCSQMICAVGDIISPGIDFVMKTMTLEDVKKDAKSNKRQGAGKGAGSPPNKQFKPGV